MDFLKTAFTVASNAAQNYYENYTKQQKLREQLKKCTYPDDLKFVIEKAVKQVFNVYPNFTTQILQFPQKGQMKRYLQLRSVLDIQIRGITQKVPYFMMLPVYYPKMPPYVRIVKQDPTSTPDKFYESLRSPTDSTSYILNQKLTQCKNWNQTKSIVNIIIESHNMMRQKFPFVKQKPTNNNNQNLNNQDFYHNQNYNQYNQYGGNNTNYGFINPQNNYNNNNQNRQRPPIPFNTSSLPEILANGQNFVGNSKKIIEKLKGQHLKSVEKIQLLETFQVSLQSEEQYLRSQNVKIKKFLDKSQSTSSSFDVQSLIRPRDQLSEQTLQLVSSIRARQDCLMFLETKFNQNQISYQEFIKLARKIEEEKFEDKFLLIKCIQKSK